MYEIIATLKALELGILPEKMFSKQDPFEGLEFEEARRMKRKFRKLKRKLMKIRGRRVSASEVLRHINLKAYRETLN